MPNYTGMVLGWLRTQFTYPHHHPNPAGLAPGGGGWASLVFWWGLGSNPGNQKTR